MKKFLKNVLTIIIMLGVIIGLGHLISFLQEILLAKPLLLGIVGIIAVRVIINEVGK